MRYLTIGTDPARQRRVSRIALVDTANNDAFWVNGTQGGESEQLLGRGPPAAKN